METEKEVVCRFCGWRVPLAKKKKNGYNGFERLSFHVQKAHWTEFEKISNHAEQHYFAQLRKGPQKRSRKFFQMESHRGFINNTIKIVEPKEEEELDFG